MLFIITITIIKTIRYLIFVRLSLFCLLVTISSIDKFVTVDFDLDYQMYNVRNNILTYINKAQSINNQYPYNLSIELNKMSAHSIPNFNPDRWIHLSDGKSFSRLLYTNPVCFLSIFSTLSDSSPPNKSNHNDTSSTLNHEALPDVPSISSFSSPASSKNVMILSWMTATNNLGRFVFSLNQRRHTAKAITSKTKHVEFVLSVPVQGMEELVLNVGCTSSRWRSKFPADYYSAMKSDGNDDNSKQPKQEENKTSGKKKRKRNHEFAQGVPNLEAVSVGHVESGNKNEKDYFAINGTVAHMRCRTISVMTGNENDNDFIDNEHYLVSAEIIDAYVHPNYWDEKKHQFRPLSENVPPYLTFYGAQTFGYVVSTSFKN